MMMTILDDFSFDDIVDDDDDFAYGQEIDEFDEDVEPEKPGPINQMLGSMTAQQRLIISLPCCLAMYWSYRSVCLLVSGRIG